MKGSDGRAPVCEDTIEVENFGMQMKATIRLLLAAAIFLPAASMVLAQVTPYGEKTMGDPAQDRLPDVLHAVKIDQRLGQQLPLGRLISGRDGQGSQARRLLRQDTRVLSLVYYQCPILFWRS